jgi:PHD/YefM family antitoxin component YafN of YafNO toxin-antitoxin module
MKTVTKREFKKGIKKYMKTAEIEPVFIAPKKNSWPKWVLMSSAEYDGLLGY